MNATRRALVLALPALAAQACGYALVGRGGGAIPPEIKKIGVPLFQDQTGKGTIDQKVTQKVIDELLRRGHVEVLQQRDGVDALVEGTLTSYDPVPVGFSEQDGDTTNASSTAASRYAITLTARVRYSKTADKTVMWTAEAFQVRDEYDIGNDPATFFDREEQAIERLTTTFARNLVAAMLEAF